MSTSCDVQGSQLLVDFAPPPDISSEVGAVAYVDNGIFCSTVRGVAKASQTVAERALAVVGLPVHDITEEAHHLQSLGLALGPTSAGIKPSRQCRLEQALVAIERRPVLSGQQVEVLTGHFNFCFLLARCSLAVFSAIYRFQREHYLVPLLSYVLLLLCFHL